MIEDMPVEVFLERYPPAIRETGLRLHKLIRIAVPGAVEGVRSGWSWIGYGLPDRRAKRTFAWIGPERKHIHLGFEYGAWMADSGGLLEGAHLRLRKVRFLTFEAGQRLDVAALVDLTREGARVAGLSRAERLAAALDRP